MNKIDEKYQEIFQYEYIKSLDKSSKDYMIRFHLVKNINQLIDKLLIHFKEIGLVENGFEDVWMNDEFLINLNSRNGQIIISRDNYDMVFIMAPDNKTDLDYIEKSMSKSPIFKKLLNEK